MANLKTCSRCKSEIDISYVGLNRKKETYNTCVNCRSKPKNTSITLKRSDTDFVDAGDTVRTEGDPQVKNEYDRQVAKMREHIREEVGWTEFDSSSDDGGRYNYKGK